MFELGIPNVCLAFSICNNNLVVENMRLGIRLLYIFVFFHGFFSGVALEAGPRVLGRLPNEMGLLRNFPKKLLLVAQGVLKF